MTAIGRASARTPDEATSAGLLLRLAITLGTIIVIIALALPPLLTPVFIHPALDVAGSAELAGLTASETRAMSDRSVRELVIGPGTFAFSGPDGQPFYDASERGHLRDARIVLWLWLGVSIVVAGAIALALRRAGAAERAARWRAVGRGGAVSVIGVIAIGIIGLVAFGTLFRLFHEVFFPGGNFTFDPRTQRLVQLYPFAFWQLAAAALGILVAIVGALTWLLARRRARVAIADRTAR